MWRRPAALPFMEGSVQTQHLSVGFAETIPPRKPEDAPKILLYSLRLVKYTRLAMLTNIDWGHLVFAKFGNVYF